MPLHVNNVFTNAPQYYIMRKFPILFKSAPAILSQVCVSMRISPIQRPQVGLSCNKVQDRQWTYHVTLMRIRETIVAVDKQSMIHIVCVCVCVCSLRCPACNAHAPYFHLWPTRLYEIFPQRHDFRKNFTEHTMCFLCFLQLCLNHFSF
jgi:hypothetical protein